MLSNYCACHQASRKQPVHFVQFKYRLKRTLGTQKANYTAKNRTVCIPSLNHNKANPFFHCLIMKPSVKIAVLSQHQFEFATTTI